MEAPLNTVIMSSRSRSKIEIATRYSIRLLLLLNLLGLCTQPLHATAIAIALIQSESFTITPSAGSVTLSRPWTAASNAGAENSIGDSAGGYNFSSGGIAQTSEAVPSAQGYSVADGGAFNLLSFAEVSVPTSLLAASAYAGAEFWNTEAFSITGGSGPVDVTFTVPVQMTASVFTDTRAYNVNLFADYYVGVANYPLIFKYFEFIQYPAGKGWSSDSFSGTLSGTITLDFDQTYPLYVDAFIGLNAANTPEPSTGCLLLLGAAGPLIRRLRRRT